MRILKKILMLILSLIILWATGFGVFAGLVLTQKPQKMDQTTDAIVVLTGGKNRVEAGLELFAAGKAAHLFITGVHKDVRKKEILMQWHGDNALPPCCISLGYNAHTTVQNAEETREWLKENPYHSLRIVTGHYHMPRAILEFKHALPDVEIIPYPVPQPPDSYEGKNQIKLLFAEYNKTLFRALSMALHLDKHTAAAFTETEGQ
ncbi:MAG: YdcF family protein [Alphaproteobacteria bacterium]|nr:YdcF family protein [Alphaproteobacteria bacterium]